MFLHPKHPENKENLKIPKSTISMPRIKNIMFTSYFCNICNINNSISIIWYKMATDYSKYKVITQEFYTKKSYWLYLKAGQNMQPSWIILEIIHLSYLKINYNLPRDKLRNQKGATCHIKYNSWILKLIQSFKHNNIYWYDYRIWLWIWSIELKISWKL